MKKNQKTRPLPKTVKETVDFLYEFLIQHPDGIQFSLDTLGGKTERTIATILVRRGIIERTNLSPLPGKHGRACKYKWAATLAPTKTLYGSIVKEIRDAHKAWPSNKNKKKVDDDKPIVPEVKEPTPSQDDIEKNQFILEYSLDHSYGFADKPGLYAFPDGESTIYVLTDAAGHKLAATEKCAYGHSAEDVCTISNRYHGGMRCTTDEEIGEFIKVLFNAGGILKWVDHIMSNVVQEWRDQKLWDELKKRGYSIEGNRLVIVKKTYLD